MNNEKYNIIKKEILEKLENFNLSEKETSISALKELREKLKNDLINNPEDKDRAGILLAFYECTLNNADFNILNNFCKEKFIEYFNTRELIEKNFDDIITNDTLYNAIVSLGSNDYILRLYEYTKAENDLFLSNNDKKYDAFFNKINDLCVSKGLVKPTTILKATDVVIDEEKEKAVKTATLFQETATNIGVETAALFNEVKKEEGTLQIDEIRISSYVANLLTNKNAIISTIPFKRLRTFLKRINQKRVFKNLDFEIINIDDLNILRISGDEVALDKIASCDNNIFKKIVNSVKRKKKIEESIDDIDENTIISSIKKADVSAQLEDDKKIDGLSINAASLVSNSSFVKIPEGYLETLDKGKVIDQNDTSVETKTVEPAVVTDNYSDTQNDLTSRYAQYDISKSDSVFETMSPEEYDILYKKVIAAGGTKVAGVKPNNMKKM